MNSNHPAQNLFFKHLALLGMLTAALVFTGCSKDKGGKGDQGGGESNVASVFQDSTIDSFKWFELSEERGAQIKIVNMYGEPVANAQILIGDAVGNPFRDNFITTDQSGVANVPVSWATRAAVTVQARGYIRQTILGQNPGDMIIRLSTAYLPTFPEVKGIATGLPVVDNDKLVDFALVMPMMRKADLINIDISQIISPFTDTISAAGQKMSVPSNVSLPRQKENYVIGITLNKPLYRLKTPTLGPKKYVATRGRFVFKKVVDEFRAGKAFHELINHFTIFAGGMRDAVVTGPETMLDISANDYQFTSQLSVNPTTPQNGEVALVIAANDIDGYMMPTDVKRVTAGQQTKLQTMPSRSVQILNIIKKESEFMSNTPGSDRISASLLPYSANREYRMLPLIENPSMSHQGRYVINAQVLRERAGMTPVGTTAAISDLTEITDNGIKVLVPIRRWEVVGFGWQSQIALPQWPLEKRNDSLGTGKTRIEFSYIGSSTSRARQTLDNATHVTHASADY